MENMPRARSQHLTIWHALTKNIRKDPESPQLCSSCNLVTVQTQNCFHVLLFCSCSQAALLQSAQCKEWKKSFCIAETYKNYCPVRGHLQDTPVVAVYKKVVNLQQCLTWAPVHLPEMCCWVSHASTDVSVLLCWAAPRKEGSRTCLRRDSTNIRLTLLQMQCFCWKAQPCATLLSDTDTKCDSLACTKHPEMMWLGKPQHKFW